MKNPAKLLLLSLVTIGLGASGLTARAEESANLNKAEETGAEAAAFDENLALKDESAIAQEEEFGARYAEELNIQAGVQKRGTRPPRGGQSTTYGNTQYYSKGGQSTTYGNTEYYSKGGQSTTYGNTDYYSKGGQATTYGNTQYYSNGGQATTYGNTVYFSKGGQCTTYGSSQYCS